MTKKIKKKMSERIIGIFLLIVIINFTVFFVKGLGELIENQTVGIIIFYGLVAVFIIWRLGDFLKEALELIFNKKNLLIENTKK